ncbi:MAG: transcriptional regulator [Burkholderiales bacterium]|jgi:HTH-type transcriptional regulator/antitoxin HigA|nr:transcriptional regulator [Burkholderiales bacterium]
MDIKPVRAANDDRAALREIDGLMDAKPRTPEADRLDVLVTLVEAWERRHFPMDVPDAIEAIRFRMEQQNVTPKDREPFIGRSNRVYEVLSRKRSLTLPMIRRLHAGLGIPAESLLRQVEAESTTAW